MCKAFSCLVDVGAKVTWKFGVDSHTDLVKLAGYTDQTADPAKMTFARVEITPDNKSYLSPDKWSLRVDETITPVWFAVKHQEAALAAHKKWAAKLYKSVIRKEIVHPFELTPPEITRKHIRLLKQWDSVGDSVWASVRASVWASVGDSVWDSVGDSVWASVWDSVGASVRDHLVRAVYGQHDAAWLAFYLVFRGLVPAVDKLDGLERSARASSWWWPYAGAVILTERPTVLCRDDRGRLHSPDGPAILYPDGWGIWAWHGVRLPRHVIEQPATITVKEIEAEGNAEIRRVMVERYGQARYLLDSGAKLIHSDEFGTLYRKEQEGDEPLVMVKVVNATREPDGSFKDYWLRVDPRVRTAREAVAWTFDVPAKDYAPAVQT